MPLNKDILGTALKTAADAWNDKEPAEIGDLSDARLAYWKAVADEIIKHFKANAVVTVTVTTTGTAAAQTGTGTGGIT